MTVTRYLPITDPNLDLGIAGIVTDALRADYVDTDRWKVRAVFDPADLTRVALSVMQDHAGIAEQALRALGFTVDLGPRTFELGHPVAMLYVREPVISHHGACDLIARVLEHDEGAPVNAIRALLAVHHDQPGPGRPAPACAFCNGTGRALGAAGFDEHCHCACGVCVGCGDALCEGPCETIAEISAHVAPHDLPAAIAVEDQHETAGRLDPDDRRTCHTHRQWATDCAQRHADDAALLALPTTERQP